MPSGPATDLHPASSPTSLGGLGPEVGALLDAARDLASTLELRPLLEVLLDHLKHLVDYAGTSIWRLEGDELAFLGFRGPSAFNQDVARVTSSRRPEWSRTGLGWRAASRSACPTSGTIRMLPRCFGGSLVAARCGPPWTSSPRSCGCR
jgi:hypothetical protein